MGAAIGEVTLLLNVEIVAKQPGIPETRVGEVQYGTHLDPAFGARFRALLQQYKPFFGDPDRDLGHNNAIEHEIDTQGAKPVQQYPYRNSAEERHIFEGQVGQILEKGVVRVNEPLVVPNGACSEARWELVFLCGLPEGKCGNQEECIRSLAWTTFRICCRGLASSQHWT